MLGGVAALVAGVLAQAAVVTTIAAASTRRALSQSGAPARELAEGTVCVTGARVPAAWWRPWVQVSIGWSTPRAPSAIVEDDGFERATPSRRGRADGIVRVLEVRDLLGLAVARRVVDAPGAVRTLPGAGAIEAVEVLPAWWRGDVLYHPDGTPAGDLLDQRAYAPGDPIRRVLWPVYARTRQLIVRAPERAVSPVDEVVAWLVAASDDDAAAGAAWVAIRSGQLGRSWRFGADGVAIIAREPGAALEVLLSSASTSPELGATGLAACLADATAARSVVVFAPGERGAWEDRLLAVIRASEARFHVVLCADGITEPAASAWWRAPTSPEGVARDAARALLSRFAGVGAAAVWVDRRTGRRLRADGEVGRG